MLPALSKAPSSIAGDMNSERGFFIDSLQVSRGEGGGKNQDLDLTSSQK